MAEEQEKDNFWLIIGGIIIATIVLVLVLKGRETEHLASGAVAASNAEVFSKIESRKTSNVTGNVGN